MDKVFISFKNSVNGVVTEDARIARDLYDRLTDMHIDCFYSNVTLGKLGIDNYMRSIEKAINEAKVMVVVTTEKEHISSGWVRQEWLTFLNLCLGDETRRLFTYVPSKYLENKSVDELLPAFLRPFQSFKSEDEACSFISKNIDFYNDVASEPVSERAFWNGYFGLFNSVTRERAIKILPEIKMSEGLKAALTGKHLIETGRVEEGFGELEASLKSSSVCGYYLCGHYYITGAFGEKSLPKAKEHLAVGIKYFRERKKPTAKVLILLFTWHKTASAIHYYAELLYKVLKAYKVSADVRVYDKNSPPELDGYEHLVTFLNDEAFNYEKELCRRINEFKKGKFFILNNFLEDVCPKFIRKNGSLGCDDFMLAEVARTLINAYGTTED